MTQRLQIPQGADYRAVSNAFSKLRTTLFDPDSNIEISLDGFLKVDAVAQLTAESLLLKSEGLTLEVVGAKEPVRYLQRMDFNQHLGLQAVSGRRHSEKGRFLPIKLIETGDDVCTVVNGICDLLLCQFDEAKKFIPAMEWAVNELIDNIIIHAESPVPGVVCAQYYPKTSRLEVAICDMGRGLKESLSSGHEVPSHQAALELALTRGVTRDENVGQGNGMAGSHEICRVNRGELKLWSGDAEYRLKQGELVGFEKIEPVRGTGLFLGLDTSNAVRLTDTWIASGDWTFIDSSAQRLSEGDGYDIAEECANTGTRPPGKYLRRKIVSLLPEMDEPLVLNFEKVKGASSSFLDELLGRLAKEFGADVFDSKVKLVGMNETVRKTANVVIAQRTGDLKLNEPREGGADRPADVNRESEVNGWLLRVDRQLVSPLVEVEMPFAGELFEGLKEGDYLAILEELHVVGIARVFRKRCGVDDTGLYFDRAFMLETPMKLSWAGIRLGNGEELLVRQSWDSFLAVLNDAGMSSVDELPEITGRDPIEQSYLRKLLELSVKDDLLGPAMGPNEEIIGMSVRDRYLVGKLAPKVKVVQEVIEGLQGQGKSDEEALAGAEEANLSPHVDQRSSPGEDFATAGSAKDSIENQGGEIDVTKSQTFAPSSIGLTFCVDGAVEQLEVEVRWGRYQRSHDHEHYSKRNVTNKKTGEKETVLVKERVWKRIPSGGSLILPMVKGLVSPLSPDVGCPDVILQGTIREPLDNGDRLVTLFLLNDQEEPGENQDEAWLFQPEVIVRDCDGRDVFRRKPMIEGDGHDAERESLEMIYRKRVEFAVGHSVSVSADIGDEDSEHAKEVRTRVMPGYEVAVTETPGLDVEDRPGMQRMVQEGLLDMERLALMEKAELVASLSVLTDDYELWIAEQRARIGGDVRGYDLSANEAMANCDDILDRLREGIDVLGSDEKAFQAFQFANRVMATQRIRSMYALSRRRGVDVSLESLDIRKNRSWRPFQLAFILLSVPALTDPEHSDRTEPLTANADLLWFPTGGGKTEAYLGVAAFTMAVRRLQGELGGYDGTRGLSVIMRYTLRLLTLQQFQRATTLICAMESLRRENAETWGECPFSIGLWVGDKVTPNKTEDSHGSIEKERAGKKPKKASPAQLTTCPWCGNEILPGRDVEVRRFQDGDGRTVVYCGDKFGKCDFSKRKSKETGLPINVVDEEIYRRPPSMLIATVDKFAMMAWRGETRTLFGRVTEECSRHGLLWPGSDCSGKHPRKKGWEATRTISSTQIRPPDLIIQDEFHLISGPLGTMVGLYETAVDELGAWELGGKKIKPKVIASTATIRKADEQVNNVFLRRVAVFPPSGLDVEDNFFSVQRPISKKPGRRYLGVCSPGSSRPAVLIRLYTALLTAAQDLFGHFGEPVDPYMTAVGYFNSLKELGGMKRLCEDDVQTRSYRVQMSSVLRPGLAQRKVNIVEELTSRVASKEIPRKLDQLEITFKGELDKETGLHEVKRIKEEDNAIDVVLATNMLSVGVDINRLGLMAVNGQPKSTAEYIQATSRVGRSFPGLVCTVLTWSRPRDLSHYETFEHYHATFYKHVEAQSVTPFAPRALDRGLTGMMLSWMRLANEAFNPNLGASELADSAHPVANVVKDLLRTRAWLVTSLAEARDLTEAMVSQRFDDWVKEASRGGRRLGYEEGKARRRGEDDIAGLLKKPGFRPWDNFTVPMSLREVESGVNLVMEEESGGAGPGPPWSPRVIKSGDAGGEG